MNESSLCPPVINESVMSAVVACLMNSSCHLSHGSLGLLFPATDPSLFKSGGVLPQSVLLPSTSSVWVSPAEYSASQFALRWSSSIVMPFSLSTPELPFLLGDLPLPEDCSLSVSTVEEVRVATINEAVRNSAAEGR